MGQHRGSGYYLTAEGDLNKRSLPFMDPGVGGKGGERSRSRKVLSTESEWGKSILRFPQ